MIGTHTYRIISVIRVAKKQLDGSAVTADQAGAGFVLFGFFSTLAPMKWPHP